MHVAVRDVERDQGVPAPDFDEGGDVDECQAVVGEEAHGPARDPSCGWVGLCGVAEFCYAVGVEGAEGAVVVFWIGGRQDGLVSLRFFGFVVLLV